jgi:hypothetical protein
VLVSISVLLACGFALVLLALAVDRGIASQIVLDVMLTAAGWIVAAVLVSATVYLLWSGIAERLLTAGYVLGTLVFIAAFGAAWLLALSAAGARPVVPMLGLLLVPLLPSVLAPWAFSRIRVS